MEPKKVIIAFGGNALQQSGDGDVESQFRNARETCKRLVEIIQGRYSILITHGNGPQIGEIMLKDEHSKELFPPMPMDVCGAESQGMIGYMIQRYTVNYLKQQKRCYSMNFPVMTILTQTLVDADDPAFENPTKPVGPYYTAEQAESLQAEKGWKMVEQKDGYRRLVPSPVPVDIIESPAIRTLFAEGWIVIACGGGGIPVIQREDGTLYGVEGVVDKDHTAAMLGRIVNADILLILTTVEKVSLNYGQPDEAFLDTLTIEQAKEYQARGHFPPGSMGPKMAAAIRFVEEGGEKAIITSLECAVEALEGKTGTTITAS